MTASDRIPEAPEGPAAESGAAAGRGAAPRPKSSTPPRRSGRVEGPPRCRSARSPTGSVPRR
ncbi:hypothetical protein ACU686_32810 [Yinghuangia aomiensis]